MSLRWGVQLSMKVRGAAVRDLELRLQGGMQIIMEEGKATLHLALVRSVSSGEQVFVIMVGVPLARIQGRAAVAPAVRRR